jgi:hypothetical protein
MRAVYFDPVEPGPLRADPCNDEVLYDLLDLAGRKSSHSRSVADSNRVGPDQIALRAPASVHYLHHRLCTGGA